jgi:hypothetical protein
LIEPGPSARGHRGILDCRIEDAVESILNAFAGVVVRIVVVIVFPVLARSE